MRSAFVFGCTLLMVILCGSAEAKIVCVIDSGSGQFFQLDVKPDCKVSTGTKVKISSVHGAWFHNGLCAGQNVSGVTGTCVSPGNGASLEINLLSAVTSSLCRVTAFQLRGGTLTSASGISDLAPFDGTGDNVSFVPASCKTRLPL